MAQAKQKTYENPATGKQEKLDPSDPETQRRVQSGELREAPDDSAAGGTGQAQGQR